MAGTQIKVSSRTVLDLLACKLSYDDFPDSYKMEFVSHASEGRLLINAAIEHVADKDDDWLVLEFGERDAAVSPFICEQDPN